jgi:hypothetical protein
MMQTLTMKKLFLSLYVSALSVACMAQAIDSTSAHMFSSPEKYRSVNIFPLRLLLMEAGASYEWEKNHNCKLPNKHHCSYEVYTGWKFPSLQAKPAAEGFGIMSYLNTGPVVRASIHYYTETKKHYRYFAPTIVAKMLFIDRKWFWGGGWGGSDDSPYYKISRLQPSIGVQAIGGIMNKAHTVEFFYGAGLMAAYTRTTRLVTAWGPNKQTVPWAQTPSTHEAFLAMPTLQVGWKVRAWQGYRKQPQNGQ